MPDKYQDIANGPVTFIIKVNGEELSNEIIVKNISVYKCINKIPNATIQLYDGGIADSSEFAADSGNFNPGSDVEISVGYASKEENVFKGIITRHGLKVTSEGISLMIIECKDNAVKMTVGRNNALFLNKKDSEIITEIIGNHGLSSDIESTSYTNTELIQNYCTDWDFIMQRSEINGMLTVVEDGKLIIKKPASSAGIISISPGNWLKEFNAYIDAKHQHKEVNGVSWDPVNQEIFTEKSAAHESYSAGNIDFSKLTSVLNLESYNLQSTASLTNEVLTGWTKAKHIKMSYAKIQGTITIEGYPKIKPGNFITLEGMSKPFNGDIFIGGVEHYINNDGFTTVLELGIDPDWYTEKHYDMNAPEASGIAPPMQGLFVGVVVQIDSDPDSLYRVKVKLPTLNVDNLSVWARLATFYATADSGIFFYPEVGDEVVIGFFNNDPQSPVILGSMYNGKSAPAYTPDDKNINKAIVTKAGSSIHFEEEKKMITISTPGGNTIVMDDDGKMISLEDMNSNKIEMTDSGIKFTSPKDIVLEATGKVEIKSTDATNIKATGDLIAEGMNVEFKGSIGFKAEGAMVEVKGSGQTTIKGGIVMIN